MWQMMQMMLPMWDPPLAPRGEPVPHVAASERTPAAVVARDVGMPHASVDGDGGGDGDGDGGRGAVAKQPGVRVGVGSDAASWGTRWGGGRGDGDAVGGGGGPQKAGMAGARGLGAAASETHPALHTPANPPPAPSGAARAARPGAFRDHLVDVGVVG